MADTHKHTHTVCSQFDSHACFWGVGRTWRIWGEPRENMQHATVHLLPSAIRTICVTSDYSMTCGEWPWWFAVSFQEMKVSGLRSWLEPLAVNNPLLATAPAKSKSENKIELPFQCDSDLYVCKAASWCSNYHHHCYCCSLLFRHSVSEY